MPDGVPTWEEVARDYGRFLYNVAYRLAGNDSDAQDLVQEALLRVRKGLERYQPGSLEGWLARIVTNVFLDEMRRRKRRPTDALPEDPGRVLPPAPAADEAQTGLSDEIQHALAELPEEFRVPVVLCDVVVSEITAGLGHGAEIMDVVEEMGISYLAVERKSAIRAGEMQRRYKERLRALGRPADKVQRTVPDFIVGAHALLQCSALITRDAGFFRDYFKGLKVIVPKAS